MTQMQQPLETNALETDTRYIGHIGTQRALEMALGVPFTSGNSIEVLRNGNEIFPAMLQAIAEANYSIDFLTFIYWRGRIATAFALALSHAAERGVSVRVILDAIGAFWMRKRLVRRMERAGVEVRYFRRPGWRFWRIDNRTHRKVLVCDHRVGFTGGVGIAEEWEGNARSPGEWRDSHFAIRGPAVDGLRSAFVGSWLETGPHENFLAGVPPSRPKGDGKGKAKIQVVRATSSIGWSDIATLLAVVLDQAEKYLNITTAYFVPNEATLSRLCDAARRGVLVRILNCGHHSDHPSALWAARHRYQRLLDCGVEIYEFQPTLLHQKLITSDHILACIGSANFNHRSMRKDDEISLSVLDERTVATLDEQFEQDLKRSKRVLPEEWAKRKVSWRIAESTCNLLSAEM